MLCTLQPDFDKPFILLKMKDKGGLTYPSNDVLKVAEISERVFRRYVSTTSGKVLTGVLGHISSLALFQNIKDHMFDTEVTDNHIHTLCKSIVNTYIQIRFHHEAKTFTSTIRGTNVS